MMTIEHKSTKGPHRARAALTMTVVVMAAIGLSMAGQAQSQGGGQGGDAEITVVWDEDGMGFNVTSSKDLSNVIVQLCPPGETHKHEERFNGTEMKTWEHREDQDILAIWVKSGNNHDPENPAPPPFDNPGAGEKFENPFADCEEPEPVCVGPSNVSATGMVDGTILVSWDGVNGEDGYNIYRQTGGGNFTFLAHVDAPTTEFSDNDTVVGTTYTYRVTATTGEAESDFCEEASATAIPVFPGLVATSMAILASIGAYGFVRRRR